MTSGTSSAGTRDASMLTRTTPTAPGVTHDSSVAGARHFAQTLS